MTRLLELKGKPAKSLGNGIFEAKIIEAGQGSSGYYTPELLKEYGPTTFRAGRPSFANHPTEAEFENGRDMTKIMAKLVTDAEFREADNALYAQIKVRPEWIDFVEEYKDVIGLSIFASGSIVEGEIDGQKTMIVESFDADDPYTSVDFVVAAGAGGKVERMLESFKAKTSESLTSDRREQLSTLVKDAHGNENTWVWVRDFDESTNTVYFDVESNGDHGIFSQQYSVSDDIAIELLDSKVEVRVQTAYVSTDSRQASENNNKEKVMTPEEKAEFAGLVAAAVAEALKPAPKEDEGTKTASAAEVAEAVVAADLPESARKRVFEALDNDPSADVAEVISKEKTYVDALVAEAEKSAEPVGRLQETGVPQGALKVRGW